MSGFLDRLQNGFGHFITEEMIQQRQPGRVADLLRVIPGLRVVPAGALGSRVLISRFQGRFGGACQPKLFIDGIVVTPNGPLDLDRFLTPEDVVGIEVYRGPAEMPARFGGAASACGVIVVWTK